MKKLFESADVYLSRSDWKDLALIKFCLFGMGLLVGSSLGAKARRPAAFAGLALFVGAYIPLMAKYFGVLKEVFSKEVQ
ncbi:MAG: permease of phosphate ABC transporter [Oscillospiraceae bacterium]|nr:permease of phosphate ABC transporter [Oscillospiraceae bacterium]